MKRLKENLNNSKKRMKFSEEGEDLGIIESISLRNFMCHDNLNFEFDPHINFIIGQNGSGKSAILTGIILALGGKSSSTGRYANIKGFIKTGKQKAFLSVVLKNCGEFAYKPKEYGKKIIVDREISAEGVSSYKLKSDSGRIISTQKEELKNILNAMDIQIENPVLVLTQETSRNFLMSKHSKEEKLYEFFYKGTGLQMLEDNYKQAEILKDDAEADLQLKIKALPEMKKELVRWKRILDSDSKVSDFRQELMWATINLMEQRVKEDKETLTKHEKELSSCKTEAEKCKNRYNEWCLKLEEYQKQRTECDAKITVLKISLSELNAQREQCMSNVRKSGGAVDLHKRQEKKLIEDTSILKESIRENQEKIQNDFEENKRRRNREILNLENENAKSAARLEQLHHENERLHKIKQNMRDEIDTAKAEINRLVYKKSAIINNLQKYKNAIQNRQVLFGEHTPKVLEEIRQRTREFRKLPKGPIGLSINVKDPKWNKAIEACLNRRFLGSFCCDNTEDSMLLTQILRKYCGHAMPTILTSKFSSNVYDVSRNKAQSNFPTVLDMLDIKDPVITNCLIDNLSIENKILIEDISTAQDVMLNNPPANCFTAYLLNCDEILVNPYRHYAAPRGTNNNCLLQSIDQSHIRALQQELQNVSTEIQAKEKEVHELNLNLQKLPSELKKLEAEYVILTASKSRNDSMIHDLKQSEEIKDVTEMQEDLAQLEAELAEMQTKVRDSEQSLFKHREELNKVNEALHEQQNLLRSERAIFDELGKNINSCGEKKEILASSKRQFESDAKSTEQRLKLAKKKYQDGVVKTQEAIANAEKKCKRITTDRRIEDIKLDIQETEKVIQESSNCDRANLSEKFAEKQRRYSQAIADKRRIEAYVEKFNKMLKLREKKLKDIIKHTQHCLDMAFTVVLKGNRFTGRLDFSKSGSLRLEATPKQENPSTGGKKQCSSLSGGERSFVTIAFLLALWDRIKMPFRILDEYDVFMDANNRNLSINLLIHRADFMKNVQFIFLSPLELPEMSNSRNIKIHKMPAPERIGLTNLENNH